MFLYFWGLEHETKQCVSFFVLVVHFGVKMVFVVSDSHSKWNRQWAPGATLWGRGDISIFDTPLGQKHGFWGLWRIGNILKLWKKTTVRTEWGKNILQNAFGALQRRFGRIFVPKRLPKRYYEKWVFWSFCGPGPKMAPGPSQAHIFHDFHRFFMHMECEMELESPRLGGKT